MQGLTRLSAKERRRVRRQNKKALEKRRQSYNKWKQNKDYD